MKVSVQNVLEKFIVLNMGYGFVQNVKEFGKMENLKKVN